MIYLYLCLFQGIYACTLKGILYTPKQYLADNVIVDFISQESRVHNQSNEAGYFELHFLKQSSGELTFNIANEFLQQQYLINACDEDLGNIILDNNENNLVEISGCIVDENNRNLSYAEIQISYRGPTLLDIQTIKSNDQGCFRAQDHIMKLMVYEAFLTIKAQGYYDLNQCATKYCFECTCKNGLSLYNTYNISLPIIKMKPKIIIIDMSIAAQQLLKPAPNTQIGLSCYAKYVEMQQMLQTDDNGELTVQFNHTFRKDTKYVCGIIGRHPQFGVDGFSFNLQKNNSLVLNLQFVAIQEDSYLISQVLSFETHRPIKDCDVKYSYENKSGTVQIDDQGNFTISIQLQKATNITISIDNPQYSPYESNYQTQRPPFKEFLPNIYLTKRSVNLTVQIQLRGKVTTIFGDGISNANISIISGKYLYTVQSQNNFEYIINTTFITSSTIYLSVEIVNFKIYHQQLLGNVQNNTMSINQIQDIDLTPIKQIFILKAEFEKVPITIAYWLVSTYYQDNNEYKLSGPQVNRTLQLGAKQLIKKQQWQMDLDVYAFYTYELRLVILNTSVSVTQNSTSGVIDFGLVKENNVKFTADYTLLIGNIIEMSYTNCQRKVDNVDVTLYYIFANKQYVNSTVSEEGRFKLYAGHPQIYGGYSVSIQFQRLGFLSNSIELSLDFEHRNETIEIGTFEMLSLKGPAKC